MNESGSGFNESEAEEILEGLYRPGCYEEGERLCFEIMEEVSPDWEPAKLYLLLFLAAQDLEDEALQSVDDLSSDSLFEALKHLAFGAGTETEELLYEDIVACLRSRGLEEQLDYFFSLVEKPPIRPDPSGLSTLG